jgi:hypothetical protein
VPPTVVVDLVTTGAANAENQTEPARLVALNKATGEIVLSLKLDTFL